MQWLNHLRGLNNTTTYNSNQMRLYTKWQNTIIKIYIIEVPYFISPAQTCQNWEIDRFICQQVGLKEMRNNINFLQQCLMNISNEVMDGKILSWNVMMMMLNICNTDKTAHKLTNQTNKQTKQINKNRPVAFNCWCLDNESEFKLVYLLTHTHTHFSKITADVAKQPTCKVMCWGVAVGQEVQLFMVVGCRYSLHWE